MANKKFEYASPVLEGDASDYAVMECPACGCRDIIIEAGSAVPHKSVVPMTCAAGHRFDFIITQIKSRKEIRVTCKTYDWK